MSLWGRLRGWLLRNLKCKHVWRPAMTDARAWGSVYPIRQCKICGLNEMITPEGYYAQFGENFYVMLSRESKR